MKHSLAAAAAALLVATLGSATAAALAVGSGQGSGLLAQTRDQLCVDSQQVMVLGQSASSPQVCAPDLPAQP